MNPEIKKLSILVINGPNLNLVGTREPSVYGTTTLSDIEIQMRVQADALGANLTFRQSNSEGSLVDLIQTAKNKYDVIILNAGAYTHTSIALHDALKAIDLPVIEVHLTNPSAREHFRQKSYISPVATGIISGFGSQSYYLALDAAFRLGH